MSTYYCETLTIMNHATLMVGSAQMPFVKRIGWFIWITLFWCYVIICHHHQPFPVLSLLGHLADYQPAISTYPPCHGLAPAPRPFLSTLAPLISSSSTPGSCQMPPQPFNRGHVCWDNREFSGTQPNHVFTCFSFFQAPCQGFHDQNHIKTRFARDLEGRKLRGGEQWMEQLSADDQATGHEWWSLNIQGPIFRSFYHQATDEGNQISTCENDNF